MLNKYSLMFLILLNFLLLLSANSYPADYKLPTRTDDNVVIASYNIKWFGQHQHNIKGLAKIIQYFDVCGIIELRSERDLTRLIAELEILTNQKWSYTFGMRTHSPVSDYYESFGVVWRKDRVELGNGVISDIWDYDEVYRNDPFVVSFSRGEYDFTLIFIHTRWSPDIDGDSKEEVLSFTKYITYLKGFLLNKNIFLLGDFNLSGEELCMTTMEKEAKYTQVDPNYNSTLGAKCNGYENPYDHIYIPNDINILNDCNDSSFVDSTKEIYGDDSVENMKTSFKDISDHIPVWISMKIKK